MLEALACGIPVVQPDHGAFPELVTDIAGGKLVAPEDADQLASALLTLIHDVEQRRSLGTTGRKNVHQRRYADAMAKSTLDVFERFLK